MSDAVFSEWQRQRPRSRPSTGPGPAQMYLRLALGGALLAIACVLLAFASTSLSQQRPAVSAPSVPPPPEWIDVQRPIHIFDLETPLLRGLPLVYSARRLSAGGGRQDMLVFGVPGVDAPALRLRVVRREGQIASPPLFSILAQQAAESGLSVSRSGLSDLLATRFGAFEIAEVTLTDAKLASVPCHGFRLVSATPALTIGGLACGAADKPMTRATLACVLDRLDLRSGGEDRALIDFFAATERRRDPNCRGARLAPDALHAAWLDDKPVTHAKTSRRR